MGRQRTPRHLVEHEQTAALQERFGVAQGSTDVACGMQSIGGDNYVVAACAQSLLFGRRLDVEQGRLQLGYGGAIGCLRMHQEGPRDIGVTKGFDAMSIGSEPPEERLARAARARSDLQNADLQARIVLQAFPQIRCDRIGQHTVEIVRDGVVAVNALHERERRVGKHDVRRGHLSLQHALQALQRGIQEPDQGGEHGLLQPLRPALTPLRPERLARRRRLAARFPAALVPHIAVLHQDLQALLQPSRVMRSQRGTLASTWRRGCRLNAALNEPQRGELAEQELEEQAVERSKLTQAFDLWRRPPCRQPVRIDLDVGDAFRHDVHPLAAADVETLQSFRPRYLQDDLSRDPPVEQRFQCLHALRR